jgi:hypothetical protein
MQYAKDERNLYEMNSYEWLLFKNHMSEILARKKIIKIKSHKLIYVGKKLLNFLFQFFNNKKIPIT